MKHFILILAIFICLQDCLAFQKVLKKRRRKPENFSEAKPEVRNGRFLSLFTIVRFKNDPCATSSGQNGTCYTNSECSNRGGTSDGSCAGGFGTCCYFEFNCDRTTSENATYFVNPSSPRRMCDLTINRLNDDICQIKIDLEVFNLSQPDFRGQCVNDFLVVSGGSDRNPVPTLCGSNSGQHVIYPVTQSSGPSKISVVLDTTLNNRTRDWRMKIYQYECSSPNLAPSGCLQYFTQASGQFTSFNYKTTVNSGDGPNHLANLNYAICFRIENGFCGIKYSQDPSDNFSFTISEDSSNLGAKLTDIQKVKYSDVNCKRDYVLIPGGSETGLNQDQKYSFDRFCGSTLGVCGLKNPQDVQCSPIISPVQTYTRPFVFGVVTDANDGDPITTEKQNRGFNIVYSQLPCATLG